MKELPYYFKLKKTRMKIIIKRYFFKAGVNKINKNLKQNKLSIAIIKK